MKSLQNSVLTAMTETASLPGFKYVSAVTVYDKLPVRRNSALFKCQYWDDFKSGYNA